MSDNLRDEKDGLCEVWAGANITNTIPEAIARAKREHRAVVFEFNGVTVEVAGDSDVQLIYRDWSRHMSGYITTSRVGPHPPKRLTSAEMAHDAEVEARNEARRQASQDAYAADVQAKKRKATERLESVGSMELSDAAGWATFKAVNQDGYGGAVVTYAERWARLMQVEMAEGKRLEDIADRLSSEADIEGITGFMYGCAVATLSKVWTHGETLRRWHNTKTQIRTEGDRANESGGVLNPALLNIGG